MWDPCFLTYINDLPKNCKLNLVADDTFNIKKTSRDDF